MIDNFRLFDAGPDPFGKTWRVEFRWLQTAISIRHSDSVDVKFQISNDRDTQEKVIALMLPHLMSLAAKSGRAISDPWCMKLAALHLKHMIETDSDMDKTLITASPEELQHANGILEEPIQATR